MSNGISNQLFLPGFLEMAVRAAQIHDSALGGMADITVKWNPYEHYWIAEASWSSNARVRTEDENAMIAVSRLIECLNWLPTDD